MEQETKNETKNKEVIIPKIELFCSSCHTRITNETGTARFPCPKCGKIEIVRCKHCREIASRYFCPECKFSGPN